jgi:hypothetical protein
LGALTGAQKIAAGGVHTCVIATGGAVECWGLNELGQLGDGTATTRSVPVDVPLGWAATDISVGFEHSCAVNASGSVKCWGWNTDGQLGGASAQTCQPVQFFLPPDQPCSLSPLDVVGLGPGVTAIAAGGNHTCALTAAGGVKCWGSNYSGELGGASSGLCGPDLLPCSTTPIDVVGLTSGVSAIAAGNGHTCALLTTGAVKCWGWNLGAKVGNGSTVDQPTPVSVLGLGESPDTDRDGCLDTQEQGTNPFAGGLRDTKNFWDFFDVPAGPSMTRDRRVTIGDLAAVIARFGANTTVAGDPLGTPPPAPAYHIAYDRTLAAPEPWKTGGPNGSITIEDIRHAGTTVRSLLRLIGIRRPSPAAACRPAPPTRAAPVPTARRTYRR